MSDSVRPHRPQPTRLPRPWDSPGKITGVGCHFLLQCMKMKVKVKLLSHNQLPVTPWTAAYQAPLSMGFSRQEYWSGVPLPSLKDPSPTGFRLLWAMLDLCHIFSFFFLFIEHSLKMWKPFLACRLYGNRPWAGFDLEAKFAGFPCFPCFSRAGPYYHFAGPGMRRVYYHL